MRLFSRPPIRTRGGPGLIARVRLGGYKTDMGGRPEWEERKSCRDKPVGEGGGGKGEETEEWRCRKRKDIGWLESERNETEETEERKKERISVGENVGV